MFEIEPDNIVIAQNSKLKSIFYVVDGLLIAEAGFQTDCTTGFRFFVIIILKILSSKIPMIKLIIYLI